MTRGRRAAPAVVIAGALLVALASGCAMLGFETPDSLMKEGQQLYLDRKYDEAIMKFERVIELDNTRWLAYVYIARCYMAKGGWSKAVSNARLAYQVSPGGQDVVPTLIQALWGGGIEALNNGQLSEAISELTEYLRLQPADASAYVALGRAYLQSGDRSDALNALFNALRLNPRMSEVEELVRGLR
jgi:tetratricopeptide (TPR) repeat protein